MRAASHFGGERRCLLELATISIQPRCRLFVVAEVVGGDDRVAELVLGDGARDRPTAELVPVSGRREEAQRRP